MVKTVAVILLFAISSSTQFLFPDQVFAEEATVLPESVQRSFIVKRLVISGQIENREPVGVSDSYPSATEGVYCFLEASDIEQNTEVTFTWQFEGAPVFSITLPVEQGRRWRTYSYKRLYGMAGDWKVELKDADGNTVDEVSFTVK